MTRLLSFLDLTPIDAGSTSGQALRDSVELAVLADRLGYHRLWFAEHHNSPGLASAAPEIMIAHVASRTTHLRLGAGGVMLPNHAPLKIAETFRLLEALHPGRIDLGLGRAPGTDTLTAFAMRRSREAMSADDYPEQLAELIAFDDGTLPGRASVPGDPADAGRRQAAAALAARLERLQRPAGGRAPVSASPSPPTSTPPAPSRPCAPTGTPSSPPPLPRAAVDPDRLGHGRRDRRRTPRSSPSSTTSSCSACGPGSSAATRRSRRRARYPFTPAERELIASMPMRSLAGDITQVQQQIDDLADRPAPTR